MPYGNGARLLDRPAHMYTAQHGQGMHYLLQATGDRGYLHAHAQAVRIRDGQDGAAGREHGVGADAGVRRVCARAAGVRRRPGSCAQRRHLHSLSGACHITPPTRAAALLSKILDSSVISKGRLVSVSQGRSAKLSKDSGAWADLPPYQVNRLHSYS